MTELNLRILKIGLSRHKLDKIMTYCSNGEEATIFIKTELLFGKFCKIFRVIIPNQIIAKVEISLYDDFNFSHGMRSP